jgi:hypothetical protein
MAGKAMKKAPTKTEVPVEQVQTADTAELKGDTIEVKRDFVNFGKILNRSKLTIVDKDGIDVKESMPDWHFAWFTEEDARTMEYIGFEMAHEVHGDNVKAVFQPDYKRQDDGHIRYPGRSRDQDLMAYCIPTDRYQQFLDYVQKENVIDTDGMYEQSEGVFREHGEEFSGATVSGKVGEE